MSRFQNCSSAGGSPAAYQRRYRRGTPPSVDRGPAVSSISPPRGQEIGDRLDAILHRLSTGTRDARASPRFSGPPRLPGARAAGTGPGDLVAVIRDERQSELEVVDAAPMGPTTRGRVSRDARITCDELGMRRSAWPRCRKMRDNATPPPKSTPISSAVRPPRRAADPPDERRGRDHPRMLVAPKVRLGDPADQIGRDIGLAEHDAPSSRTSRPRAHAGQDNCPSAPHAPVEGTRDSKLSLRSSAPVIGPHSSPRLSPGPPRGRVLGRGIPRYDGVQARVRRSIRASQRSRSSRELSSCF